VIDTRKWRVRRAASKIFRYFRPLPEAELYEPGVWDREYTAGVWEYMANDEVPRYAVIEGWRRRYSPAGSVLDVGCGEGLLLRLIPEESGARYTGFDHSSVAIACARRYIRCPEREVFIEADLDTFVDPRARFDVIIFNEVLYYCRDISATLGRYRGLLQPGGLFIVSVYHPKRRTWNEVQQLLGSTAMQIVSVTMPTPQDVGWNLGVYQP
jgi:2-polyprenyl-3-methyl-5-hydroxy-6-metoxy-1,4-benzoquinol methylase